MNGSEYAQMYCTKFSEISKGILRTVHRLLLTLLQTGMTSLEIIVKEKRLMIFLKDKVYIKY